MSYKRKPNPPLANGDINKKPWQTYTSSILDEKGNVKYDKNSPYDQRKKEIVKGVQEIKTQADKITGSRGSKNATWKNITRDLRDADVIDEKTALKFKQRANEAPGGARGTKNSAMKKVVRNLKKL